MLTRKTVSEIKLISQLGMHIMRIQLQFNCFVVTKKKVVVYTQLLKISEHIDKNQ